MNRGEYRAVTVLNPYFKGLFASVVTLKLRYADFSTLNRARSLAAATDRNGPLRELAVALFDAACKRRVGVRLRGVKLSGLARAARQMSLFDAKQDDKQGRLLEALDGLEEKHRGVVGFGNSARQNV